MVGKSAIRRVTLLGSMIGSVLVLCIGSGMLLKSFLPEIQTRDSGRFVVMVQSNGLARTDLNDGEERSERVDFQATDRPLFYVSTRSLSELPKLDSVLNPTDSPVCHGIVRVNIPPDHRTGQVERPQTLWSKEEQGKHFVLQGNSQISSEQWWDELQAEVSMSPSRELLVFVHGMNTSFEDAMFRLAQFRADTRYQGAVIGFAWPSRASFTFDGYHLDEASAMASVPELSALLKRLAERFPQSRRLLVAHSMGCRMVMTSAISCGLTEPEQEPLIEELVLAAPDIDASVFRELGQSAIGCLAERTTVYATPRDLALRLSVEQHGQRLRLGLCPDGFQSDGSMTMVDVTGLLQPLGAVRLHHLYLLDNAEVIEHVGAILAGCEPQIMMAAAE